ncbi:hypothetical protein F5X68DRAFT_267841 [Plectosphaerella plurivora]|uniref:Glycosyltransferase family 31 protein n=1 Tax=Plectosphaerella plurivora TaxID=936078 RepID=A0A9P8VHR9_9PEZI|nr:hypothetical protein F5X68DRAFT_267841 [Plectosphaerella plurivora]
MDDDSSTVTDPFLGPEKESEDATSGSSWSLPNSDRFPYVIDLRSKLGELRVRIGDPRVRMRPLVQRARNALSPYNRIFKAIGAGILFLIVCLNFPSMRPYTSDLVLRTTHLREGLVPANPRPVIDGHKHLTNSSRILTKPPSSTHVMNCKPDMIRLREIGDRYGLGERVEYYKRYVRFTRKPIERKSYSLLKEKFLDEDGFRTLQLSKSDVTGNTNIKCGAPLEVTVPRSRFQADVDLHDFLFAVSTTFDRVSNSAAIQEWVYWLTDGNGKPNGGKLLLQLVDPTDAEITKIARHLADVGIDAEVSGIDSRKTKHMAVRYLDLVPMLYAHDRASHDDSATRKWLVLIDDDTFFPAMNKLVERFRKYDHLKPLYIAYGGGGVFLSRPMAALITESHESCRSRRSIKRSNSGWGPQGDILLRNCIYDNSEIRLTQLHDLWQLDLSGEVSGFYESGLQPLSIHHYRGGKFGHETVPSNTTQIARTCGEDCPWQRFVTKDNFIVSNGYTVAHYPRGISFDLTQVERTFTSLLAEQGWNYDYMFGPQRPPLAATGRKVAWELRDAGRGDDGSVWQIYVRKRADKRWTTDEGIPMKALDGIIELVWVPA